VFAVVSAALLGAVIVTCYAIWGHPFYYWIFYLLSHHPVSPLRSFQHVLDTWPYFAAGLLGGLAVLRRRKADALLGAWLISLGLIASEAYTSGIAWMLNHIGPGCLIAGVWFLAGLATVWGNASESRKPAEWEDWIRAGAVTVSLALVFSGLGLIRIPLQPVSGDAYRYVRDIEKQFEGQAPGKVLLDVGSWVYLKDRVIMRDRAPSIGEEAPGISRASGPASAPGITPKFWFAASISRCSGTTACSGRSPWDCARYCWKTIARPARFARRKAPKT
jgi:hypothetical protein